MVTSTAFTATTAGAGDTTLIAGVSGQQIGVIAFFMTVSAATTYQFFDGASANNLPLSGLMSMAANGTLTPSPYEHSGTPTSNAYWFKTSAGNGLVLKNGAAGTASGTIVYEIFAH